MKHATTFTKGTDARNHVVRCSCGWAYSSTFLACRERTVDHVSENNYLRWTDPRRILQDDTRREPQR